MIHESVQTLVINETDNTKNITYHKYTHICFNSTILITKSRLYMRIFVYQYHSDKINNKFLKHSMFLSFPSKTLNKHIHFNIPLCHS